MFMRDKVKEGKWYGMDGKCRDHKNCQVQVVQVRCVEERILNKREGASQTSIEIRNLKVTKKCSLECLKPLFFGLLQSKTQLAYKNLLRQITLSVGTFSAKIVTCDFEQALIQVL